MRSRVVVVCAVAVCFAGCGTTEKSGRVGETFTDRAIRVTVERVDLRTPVVDNVTGLGRPAPGMRLLGVRVAVCVGQGAAIGTSHFAVELDGGGKARVRFPAPNYRERFRSVFAGDCGGGWIVFEAPAGRQPAAVTLKYDDTGGGSPRRDETHARFSWDV